MKQWVKIIAISCLIVATGCSNKSEMKIFTTLNDQIVSQNECNVNNQKLSDLMNEETEIYNQIIEKGLDSFDEISPLIEQGRTTVESSNEYLIKYQTCILAARVDQNALNVERDALKNDAVKQETNELITDYLTYETNLVDYVSSLIRLNEAQVSFYQTLNASTSVQELQDLVTQINTSVDEANAASLLHQESLANFNTAYSVYYEKYIK